MSHRVTCEVLACATYEMLCSKMRVGDNEETRLPLALIALVAEYARDALSTLVVRDERLASRAVVSASGRSVWITTPKQQLQRFDLGLCEFLLCKEGVYALPETPSWAGEWLDKEWQSEYVVRVTTIKAHPTRQQDLFVFIEHRSEETAFTAMRVRFTADGSQIEDRRYWQLPFASSAACSEFLFHQGAARALSCALKHACRWSGRFSKSGVRVCLGRRVQTQSTGLVPVRGGGRRHLGLSRRRHCVSLARSERKLDCTGFRLLGDPDMAL